MRGLMCFAVLFGMVSVASAGEIPHYDVQAHCMKTSKMMGNSEFMLKSCLEQEQASYNDLKPKWAGLSVKIQVHCNRTSKMMGSSYFMLKACIDQEVASLKQNQKFKFKY